MRAPSASGVHGVARAERRPRPRRTRRRTRRQHGDAHARIKYKMVIGMPYALTVLKQVVQTRSRAWRCGMAFLTYSIGMQRGPRSLRRDRKYSDWRVGAQVRSRRSRERNLVVVGCRLPVVDQSVRQNLTQRIGVSRQNAVAVAVVHISGLVGVRHETSESVAEQALVSITSYSDHSFMRRTSQSSSRARRWT